MIFNLYCPLERSLKMSRTEKKLRKVIRKIISENASGKKMLASEYGCKVFGHSISFDSFTLEFATFPTNILFSPMS